MANSTLNLDNFLPYRLSIASNLVSDVIAESYQKLFGLKVPEWRVLAVIAEQDSATQNAIVQRTRMDKVSVSRAVLALQNRHLIERKPNKSDGRSQILRLTREGKALYQQVVPMAIAHEADIFAGVTKPERDIFDMILAKIERAALAALFAKS